jgi:light-independent protochlorophyllide reductase subunit B
VREIGELLGRLGIDVHVTAPLGATPADLARLGEADFNVVLYPEIAGPAARWLQRAFGQKATETIPIGVAATRAFIAEVAALAGRSGPGARREAVAQHLVLALPSIRPYLTEQAGSFVFGDGDATPSRRPGWRPTSWLHGGRPRHLQPRARPRGPRGPA